MSLPDNITQPSLVVGRKMDYEVGIKLGLPVTCKLSYNSGSEIFYTDAPYFSTDIMDARKVLDYFQKKRFMWALIGTAEGKFWGVMYSPFGKHVKTNLCNTPEEAVCRAALQVELENDLFN